MTFTVIWKNTQLFIKQAGWRKESQPNTDKAGIRNSSQPTRCSGYVEVSAKPDHVVVATSL